MLDARLRANVCVRVCVCARKCIGVVAAVVAVAPCTRARAHTGSSATVCCGCERELSERERKDRRIGGARARRQHKARPVSNDVISLVSQRVNNYAVSRPFSCGPLRPPSPPGLFTPPQDVRPRIEIRDRHCCVESAGQFSVSRARGNRGSWRGSFTLPVSLFEIIFLFRPSLIRR